MQQYLACTKGAELNVNKCLVDCLFGRSFVCLVGCVCLRLLVRLFACLFDCLIG